MAKQAPPPDPMRRRPRQARAQETIEAIFEAAARILEQGGEAALTTNRLSEQSGFSIGGIYQYFPNKDAILLAMGRRESERIRTEILTKLRSAPDRAPEALVRQVVRALLRAFGGRARTRRSVITAVIRSGRIPGAQKELAKVADEIVAELARLAPPRARPLGPAASFVLTRSLLGAIRAAVLEESPLLRDPAFEDDLVRLVCGFLAES